MTMLRLISYLAPSVPQGYFELVARAIREGVQTDVELAFEDRISGPLPGDENPFLDGQTHIGFVCAPTYRWLRGTLELLPVPVPADPRAEGRPVYFADVLTHADNGVIRFEQLRGMRWAYNDPNSQSGWFSMLDRISPSGPDAFFSDVIQAGSHLKSLGLLQAREADAAAIDSNVLRASELRTDLRRIESWGPFPIQPIVVHARVPDTVKQAVREVLLQAHETHGPELEAFGFLRFVDPVASDYDSRPWRMYQRT